VTIREVSKKLARVSKIVCYSSRKSPETDVFRKNKIRTRLARRPTLVVLCLKLWSIRGEGTVRVQKCVILASVWASNFLLGKATKRPVKSLKRGPMSKNKSKPTGAACSSEWPADKIPMYLCIDVTMWVVWPCTNLDIHRPSTIRIYDAWCVTIQLDRSQPWHTLSQFICHFNFYRSFLCT
jgi:hypothetical protein